MAKGYHKPTSSNPFAGGPKPTVWPHEMGGRGNMASLAVPKVIKELAHEMARICAQVKAGNLTKDSAIREIKILLNSLENDK